MFRNVILLSVLLSSSTGMAGRSELPRNIVDSEVGMAKTFDLTVMEYFSALAKNDKGGAATAAFGMKLVLNDFPENSREFRLNAYQYTVSSFKHALGKRWGTLPSDALAFLYSNHLVVFVRDSNRYRVEEESTSLGKESIVYIDITLPPDRLVEQTAIAISRFAVSNPLEILPANTEGESRVQFRTQFGEFIRHYLKVQQGKQGAEGVKPRTGPKRNADG